MAEKLSQENPKMETENASSSEKPDKKPICVIVLGMAASGKTTFVQKIVSDLYRRGKPYAINLDPACRETPYPTNIGNVYSSFK